MKLILAGSSRFSDIYESALANEGFDILSADSVDSLKALDPSLPVILLHDRLINPLIDDPKLALRAALHLAPFDPIVFLMDSTSDTDPFIESKVIDTAAHLAALKRQVVVLMKSSRAPDDSFESRYLLARNNGVTFIKFDSFSISPENDGDLHNVSVFDGKLNITLLTKLLIDCSESPDPVLDSFISFLRLRTYDNGKISGGRWFLGGNDTYKRNVKFIDTLSTPDPLSIIPALSAELKQLSAPAHSSTASIDIKKCAFCYTCYRICPHSALYPDDTAAAMKVDPLLCDACGICASVCPAAAISLNPSSNNDPAPPAPKGKIKVFCCENSALIASQNLSDSNAVIHSIPCGGDLDALSLTEALNSFDFVLVAVCCDNACRHFDGNKRLLAQVERLKHRLEVLGHDPNRLSCTQIGVTMTAPFRSAVQNALAGGTAL